MTSSRTSAAWNRSLGRSHLHPKPSGLSGAGRRRGPIVRDLKECVLILEGEIVELTRIGLLVTVWIVVQWRRIANWLHGCVSQSGVEVPTVGGVIRSP